MDRKQQIMAAAGVILAAAFLLYQFHYKDSLSLKCWRFSPLYDKAECLARGGEP